jgi:hypothetical protein
MAVLALCDNFEVLSAREIDEWATINKISAAGKVAHLLAGKVTFPILQVLKDRANAHSTQIVDEAITWLHLYTIKTFGAKPTSCVADVTTHIPIAGMVQDGLDVVRLVPTLLSSGVGQKTIREFAGDYLTTPTTARIGKNGLLSLHDRPTVTVTNRDLIDMGLIVPPPKEPAWILGLAARGQHRSPEVWADRMIKSKDRPITPKDFDILSVRYPGLSQILKNKLASR